MTTLFRVATAALALSCLSSGALASPAVDTFTIRVSHVGLDLHTADGRRRFDARVRRAARSACAAPGASLVEQRHARLCMAELRSDAARQVAARFDDTGIRLASVAR
ncbi:UrcA family protein [Sphingomonas insulae]|uniref:UrcA family protein n=1 Tax=Sphingomonas insulae TaxID=424800 RepID=A0ABN1HRG8_9SPHN|nr:UrcA family protein [Sphingomonas insulae]NIJ29180.1 UrcA family protein [Sphingomonas insulae]